MVARQLWDPNLGETPAVPYDSLSGALPGVVANSKVAIYGPNGRLPRSSASPAAAGTTQATATALTAELNAVTGADGTKGVALPTAAANVTIDILNTDLINTLKVYPASGGTINALAGDAAIIMGPGQLMTFFARSATQWHSNQPAATARGQATTATASDTVVTGLATVISAIANLEDVPVIGCDRAQAAIGDQAGAPAAGSILIKTFKPTASGDATPIAATTFTKKVNWIAFGTR